MSHVHTIIVLSTDISALCSFYVKALDLPAPNRFGDDHLGIRLESGIYFGFDEVPSATPSRTVSLWFSTPSIFATYEQCLSLGAVAEYAPRKMPWGDEIASLLDPHGNRFGLRQDTEA